MNPKQQQDLITLLREIIFKLSQPLSPQEKECGWDEEAKGRWLKASKEDLEKLEKGELKEYQEREINLTRELDFSGIEKGELADLIIQFDVKWNEKYAEKPAWWWKRKEGKLGKLGDPPRKNFK